jgi:hypothetical protein
MTWIFKPKGTRPIKTLDAMVDGLGGQNYRDSTINEDMLAEAMLLIPNYHFWSMVAIPDIFVPKGRIASMRSKRHETDPIWRF